FTTGALSFAVVGHVLYFAVMTAIGLVFTTRRLRVLFLD
ncbi:ABC transporter, partial [Clavibacter michiganensis subsp. michiganensis]|nr:ABC transporter [Clavibacter michiganensis subsp. michiganensis]